MNVGSTDLALFKRRVVAELKRDKKKTIVLTLLFVVAAGLGVQFLAKPSHPRRAVAAPAAGQPADVQTDTMNAQAAENAAVQAQRDRYIRQLDTTITRDILTPSEKFFPVGDLSGDGSRVLSLGSSQNQDNRRLVVEQEAGRLVLRSTVVSDDSTAIINGQAVHVGEEIHGFQVIKIAPRQCLLQRSGVTVVLKMD